MRLCDGKKNLSAFLDSNYRPRSETRASLLSLAATQLDFDSFSDQRFTLLMGMLLRDPFYINRGEPLCLVSTSCKSTTREKTSEGAEDDWSWWAVESKTMTANKNPMTLPI